MNGAIERVGGQSFGGPGMLRLARDPGLDVGQNSREVVGADELRDDARPKPALAPGAPDLPLRQGLARARVELEIGEGFAQHLFVTKLSGHIGDGPKPLGQRVHLLLSPREAEGTERASQPPEGHAKIVDGFGVDLPGLVDLTEVGARLERLAREGEGAAANDGERIVVGRLGDDASLRQVLCLFGMNHRSGPQ